jgi:hypothetical protein
MDQIKVNNMTTESQYEKQMNDDSARDYAIELLAEELSIAAALAVTRVAIASHYEFRWQVVNSPSHNIDGFGDVFHKIATKLIDSVGDA